jgi:hypothetical protein
MGKAKFKNQLCGNLNHEDIILQKHIPHETNGLVYELYSRNDN